MIPEPLDKHNRYLPEAEAWERRLARRSFSEAGRRGGQAYQKPHFCYLHRIALIETPIFARLLPARRLMLFTFSGAALLGMFITSIAGVVFYSVIPIKPGVATAPDWALGILFGLGGLVGMYCGARAQRFVPQILIKAMMGIMLLFLASTYIIEYFRG
jgi:hypothetical protein